jgi:hypothetical protein
LFCFVLFCAHIYFFASAFAKISIQVRSSLVL